MVIIYWIGSQMVIVNRVHSREVDNYILPPINTFNILKTRRPPTTHYRWTFFKKIYE
jgi:hypothetical protein